MPYQNIVENICPDRYIIILETYWFYMKVSYIVASVWRQKRIVDSENRYRNKIVRVTMISVSYEATKGMLRKLHHNKKWNKTWKKTLKQPVWIA